MYFRTFTLIYLLCALRITAQDKGPEFLSRIRLSGEDALKKEQILSGLKSLTLLSEEKEALEDIEKAKAHNSLLDTKDKEIETTILQLQNNASALAGLGGLFELRQTISEQQKSRDKFQEDFEKQLQQNTKTKGLYLIVLPNTINEVEWDAKRFKSTAQQLLKSRAVKELNEVFISSLTEVVNRMEVNQRIRSRVSGSMLIEETPFEKRRAAAKDYIILQYLNVSPLTSGDEKSTVNGAESEIKSLHLINCANEADVERTLKALGLSAEDESALRGRINEYVRKAKDANVNSKWSISNMWTALNTQLEKLNTAIELARKTELEKNNQLRNLCAELNPEGMKSTQLKDSLEELYRKLDQNHVLITEKKLEYEAGRFYLKEKLKITIGDGAPIAVISEGILKAVQDINTSYGNKSVYSEQLLLADKMVQEAEIKGTLLRRGTLKDVWVHVRTGDDEEYYVTLISRFEVNREKDAITKVETRQDQRNEVLEGATLKVLSNISGELKIDGVSKGSIEKGVEQIFNLKPDIYFIQLFPSNSSSTIDKKVSIKENETETLKFETQEPEVETNVCSCVDLYVNIAKEMKAVNFDEDKSEKIEETYFPQLKKCEETFYRGKSEDEIKKLEEEGIYDAFLFIIKKCPVGEEEQVLFQEMMEAFPISDDAMTEDGPVETNVCDCVDLSVKALKEMKDVNFDKDKSKKIKENYKPQFEKCNETFGNKMDEEEKKIVEEEMKNCPAFKEFKALNQEKKEAFQRNDDAITEGPKTEKYQYNIDLNIEMVYVSGGTFTMGCTAEQSDCEDNEDPAHEVTLSSYYIGKFEVTQAQWQRVMGNNPSEFKNCENCPVENVNWNDCQEFIQKLNTKTGKTYRLPTEAEWEYAARGGKMSKGYKYAGSNELYDFAWYEGTSNKKTYPVGQKLPNELGIYDMSGNVFEWCRDWYANYNLFSENNPRGAESGSYRVLRGGNWGRPLRHCRVSYRSLLEPHYRNYDIGFRLVLIP